VLEKRFIESVNFPFGLISEASGVEKGPGRPPYWEMVFWWTRKPLISARAIIAGCLLPENTNPANFLRSIGIVVKKRRADGKAVFEVTPHRVKPKLRFDGVKLLDPFACFGSIPLEGLRLGLDVTACDLLPVGYVFLKAVLEYPAKYGSKLVEDVKKWGEWITERLGEDPLIKELYDEDVAVYIGSWEVKCPSCGKWTPLIANWWLARVKGDGGYKRLAWMQPRVENELIEIDIVDLNKNLGDNTLLQAKVEGLKAIIGEKEFRVPESNIETRKEKGICLHCSQPIMQVDPQTGKHYTETKTLPKDIKQRLESYIKYSISLFNSSIQANEKMEKPEWLKEIPARPRLLVKVKIVDEDLKFESCKDFDQEKLRKVRSEFQGVDPDIPIEPIPLYDLRSIWVINYGMTHWFQLFNFRQLLTLAKIVKLIREAGKLIEQEKIDEGKMSEREAFKYSEAVTTYLAIALCKFSQYSSLVTYWNSAYWGSLKVIPVMAFRGIAMQWNWCETNPLDPSSPLSLSKIVNDYISDSLIYLVSAVHNDSYPASQFCDSEKTRLKTIVLLDDATMLNKLQQNERFDLIVTDPPYYDDVPYTELSDFYYVWLKRALSNVSNSIFKPRFLPEAFFEKIGDDWAEVSTQSQKYAISEVSLNPPRLGSNVTKQEGVGHFQNLLNSSFVTMTSKLKHDGLLVTYYAHTSPDAWKALLVAGWEAAGLRVINAFPIATESASSIVSRGKLSMDTSIVVVYRKGSEGSVDASDLYAEMVDEATKRANSLLELGAVGRDLVIGTMAAALATATKYREVRVMGKIDVETLVTKYVYPAAYLGLAKALARKAELKDGIKSPDGMFYLLVKSTFAGAKKKILDSTDARIFSIGTSLDLNTAMRTWRILKAGEKESGAKVAKAKTLALMEPTSAERSKLAELLETRGIGATEPKPRCTVDALHVLEYFAVTHPREEFKRKLEELKASYPANVEDALTMARIMAKVLPPEDIEKGLCSRIIEYLEPITPKLSKFTSKEEK
jgi:putative DNA methylase